jgi:hypothetical protein
VDKLWTNTNKKICILLKVLYLCIVKSIYKQLKTKHYDFITRHQFRLRYQSHVKVTYYYGCNGLRVDLLNYDDSVGGEWNDFYHDDNIEFHYGL